MDPVSIVILILFLALIVLLTMLKTPANDPESLKFKIAELEDLLEIELNRRFSLVIDRTPEIGETAKHLVIFNSKRLSVYLALKNQDVFLIFEQGDTKDIYLVDAEQDISKAFDSFLAYQ